MSNGIKEREETTGLKIILTKQDYEELRDLKGLIIEFFIEGYKIKQISEKIVKHIIKIIPDYDLKAQRVIEFYRDKRYTIRKTSIETQTSVRYVKKILKKEGLYE